MSLWLECLSSKISCTDTMSEPESLPYDYTEGASEIDVREAFRTRARDRRLSEISTYEDNGELFDGPGHAALPSSVSTMHRERPLLSLTRQYRRRSRRRSEDQSSQSGRRVSQDAQSSEGGGDRTDDEEGIDIVAAASHSERRGSVFESVARLFRASSPARTSSPSRPQSRASGRESLSRTRSRGSSLEESERWGYSSFEETSSEELLSEEEVDIVASPLDVDFPSGPPSPAGSLPFLSHDPIFGDTRIDVEDISRPETPPPPGPPSRQKIHLEDEDLTVRFSGREIIPYRRWLWHTATVLTLGMLGLLGHWFPRVWLRWVSQEKAFTEIKDGFILIEVISFLPLKKKFVYEVTGCAS